MSVIQDNLNAAWRIAMLEAEVARLQADLAAKRHSVIILKHQRNALQERVYQLLGLAMPLGGEHENERRN